jgi:hypothetical protein
MVAAAGHGNRRNVDGLILIWLQGGLSQVDTFDPKPQSPGTIFRPIPTRLIGVQFSELLPCTAAIAHKLCVIRSMSHEHTTHEQAIHAMLTGCEIHDGLAATSFPSLFAGASAARNRMPAYVTDPGTSYTARLGFFGAGSRRRTPNPTPIANITGIMTRADIRGDWGRRLTRARRLIEAGVRCVVVDDAGWDHHHDIASAYRRRVPRLDRAFAALIDDLDVRGLLDRTRVMLLTEFGRCGALNDTRGREASGTAFSVVLAGGGLPRGKVIGRTDATGARVTHDPITPADLFV